MNLLELPQGPLQDILRRLDPGSTRACRLASKTLHGLLEDPTFWTELTIKSPCPEARGFARRMRPHRLTIHATDADELAILDLASMEWVEDLTVVLAMSPGEKPLYLPPNVKKLRIVAELCPGVLFIPDTCSPAVLDILAPHTIVYFQSPLSVGSKTSLVCESTNLFVFGTHLLGLVEFDRLDTSVTSFTAGGDQEPNFDHLAVRHLAITIDDSMLLPPQQWSSALESFTMRLTSSGTVTLAFEHVSRLPKCVIETPEECTIQMHNVVDSDQFHKWAGASLDVPPNVTVVVM